MYTSQHEYEPYKRTCNKPVVGYRSPLAHHALITITTAQWEVFKISWSKQQQSTSLSLFDCTIRVIMQVS